MHWLDEATARCVRAELRRWSDEHLWLRPGRRSSPSAAAGAAPEGEAAPTATDGEERGEERSRDWSVEVTGSLQVVVRA